MAETTASPITVNGRSIGEARGLAPTTAATGQMIIFSAGSGSAQLLRGTTTGDTP